MSAAKNRSSLLCLFVFLVLGALLPIQIQATQNVTLQWDPNTETDVIAYRLYIGTASRTYTQTVQVSAPTTSATAPNLAAGLTYYFAVTALNSSGLESGFSSEVSTTIPGVMNVPPTLNPISTVVLAQNAGATSILLSGISSGSSSELQFLTVTATSSNPWIIPSPSVSYASPSAAGSLTVTPLPNSWGSATISVTVNDGQAANNLITQTFTLIINNPPTLNPLPNISITAGGSAQVALTGITSGAANESQTLQVTAASSNPWLIPTPTISYSSPNSTGIVTLTPFAGSTGTAVITVSVNDGQAGNNSVSRSFTVTVNPAAAVNAAPTLNPIGNFVVTENSGATSVPLSGITTGSPTEIQPLTVTAVSSNPGLIPSPVIAYSSPNATGTLSFTPVANSSGSATITVTVSDGQSVNGNISQSFTVLVNNPPTLAPISDITLNQNAPQQTISLSGISSGAPVETQTLVVSASSSNPSVIPTPTVSYASPNSSGTLSLQPVANAVGSAVISVTVNDGQPGNNTITRTFNVTVNAIAPNVPPTLNPIANLVLAQNSGTALIPISGITSGSASEVQPLTVTAVSSNPWLVPAPVVAYSSPNTTGTLSLTPIANSSGSATITVTVSDGQSVNSTITRSFTVTINNPPTLSPLSDMTLTQNAPQQSIPLSGITTGAATETQTLVISASSSNPSVIPTPTVSYASPNSTGTLSFQPVANAVGSAVISVTVNDGQLGNNTITRSFNVTVNAPAPNVPPTLNPIANLVLAQNSGATSMPLSGISSGSPTENQTLTITAVSSNPWLIPNPVVNYTSPNATGTLSFTPIANSSGSATITVTVSDGQALNSTISRQFVVTVNNPPTISPLGNVTVTQNAPAQTIPVSGITSGASNEVQPLQVTATSSNPTVVGTPTMVYTSPSSTGSLIFQPVAGAVGTAVITITVNDGQPGNSSVSTSFTVTVNPPAPNVPPTLNPINNVLLAQNAGTISVPLTGISSGSPTESQPLTVTATSSNPSLVPTPVIAYSSPAASGTLSFTPTANMSGTATITVTVNDGQSANNLTTRSFVVTINSPPTLNPIANMSVAVGSAWNVVSLNGITAGGVNEVQTLTVTASSSNTGLIPTPAVYYTSPNTSGALSFATVAGASGTATITVTVKDGQTGNGVTSRSFVVTVGSTSGALSALSVSDSSATDSAGPGVPPADPAATPDSGTITTNSSDPAGTSAVSTAVTGSAAPASTTSTAAPNPSASAAVSEPAPQIGPQVSDLIVSSSDARTLVLSWQTDTSATCLLAYGASDAMQWASASSFGTSHSIQLANLEPATVYYMRVLAFDTVGHLTTSDISSAQTPGVNVLSWPAENALLTDPMLVGQEDDPNGEVYISSSSAGVGAATFNVQFPEGMSYRVWCRVKTPTTASLGISIDGGVETVTSTPEGSGDWRWVPLQTGSGPFTFLANDGYHQVTLRNFSSDARIDNICISNDPEWRPVGFDAPILSVSRASSGTVLLEWNDRWSNADGYVIEFATDGSDFQTLATVGSSDRSYRVANPDSADTSYRIYAFSAVDRGSVSAAVTLAQSTDQSPDAPQNLAATISHDGDVSLSWRNGSSAQTAVVIERSTDHINFSVVATLDASATSATDTPPGSGKYYYRAKAINSSAQSDPTDVISLVF